MSDTEWYYGEGNQQRGPIPIKQLHDLIRSGRVMADTLLWNESMTDWQVARDVAAVRDVFAEAPVAAQPLAYASPAQQGVLRYQAPATEPLLLSGRALEGFLQTKPWVQFLSVVSYICAGLLALALIFALFAVARMPGRSTPFFWIAVGYGVMAGVSALFGATLWRYGSRIATLARYRRGTDLDDAVDAQRSVWRLMGMSTMVIMGLYLALIAYAILSNLW